MQSTDSKPGLHWLLILGAAAYVMFALVTFPARLVLAWFLPEVPVSGVAGTVWSGTADTIVAGQVRLEDVTWKAHPLALATGRASYTVRAGVAGGSVQARASAGLGGTIRLRDVAGVLPLAAFAEVAPVDAVDGRIGLDFASATIADEWITDATGSANLVSLNVLAPVNEALGSYELAFEGAGDSGLQGRLSDVQGPLAVNGTLTLGAGKSWSLDATVKAKPSASQQLAQSLSFVGERQPDGSYRLRYDSDGR